MLLHQYLDADLLAHHLVEGYVQVQHHKYFPLDIYSYTRKCVCDNLWDGVTSRCRGVIFNRETNELVARPFFKFHNYRSPQAEGTLFDARVQPTVWEKMDGFMVTAFKYEGVWHAASKSSFHSIHAKWATAELRRHANEFPEGWTPVFEGLHPDLRIVVNYGDRKELVLLTLINIETGEEMTPVKLRTLSGDYNTPDQHLITLAEAKEHTLDDVKNDEGYVLTWYQDGKSPIRLKMKYVEYLRLHRMVCGVSPKRIWESLSQPHLAAELREYLDNSTPWFAAFVRKWVKILQTRFDELQQKATDVYTKVAQGIIAPRLVAGKFTNLRALRKAYALEFNKPENAAVRAICFSMMDGKDTSLVIWKDVKALTEGGHPMADAF